MRPERFNGVKIDLDGLSDPEKTNLVTYTARRAAEAIKEMAILEQAFGLSVELPENVTRLRQPTELPPQAA